MGAVHDIYDAWKTAKGVSLCFVLSLAAGWLTRELSAGNIDSANTAAAYILDLTLFVILCILSIGGAVKWRSNQLTPAAKRIVILSLGMLIVFFVVGWNSDISLE